MVKHMYRYYVAVPLWIILSGDTLGEGLPFVIQKYEPSIGSTVIIPKPSADAVKTVGKLEEKITNIKDPIWKASVLASIERSASVARITGKPPLEESAQGFVEVNDIFVDGAKWLKLRLKPVDLGNVTLLVSSPITGASQPFTGTQLVEWNGYSRLFSGDRVRLQMIVEPGEKAPAPLDNLVIEVIRGTSLTPEKPYPDEVTTRSSEQSAGGAEEEAPCGIDARTATSQAIVGRMRPAMCTVFALSGDVFVSAGHCFRSLRGGQEVEFNVPSSTESGVPVDAPSEHVYPVIASSIRCSDCTVGVDLKHGMDWSVFRLGRNTISNTSAVGFDIQPLTAYETFELQGVRVNSVMIPGYGWDNNPVAAFTEQQARGAFFGFVGTPTENDVEIGHFVDTEGGNSGSPIIALTDSGAETQMVLGIHTGGRCNPANSNPNLGTGFANRELKAAVAAVKKQSN